ncbi:secondary thiamine-phosphate synthase enzyme YjbQ [Hyphococcus sp.]|uniref:secondary thiamine-phosphate synthase enzyme YjbQ n=1 Tax=Hyphococcus sp. TaxID=2038636 RepID=UPI003CCB7DA2
MQEILTIDTPGRGFLDMTRNIEAVLESADASSGVAHIFIQHTSASLTVQENADPDVQRDLLNWLDRMAPEDGNYLHTAEGPDDMPAHIKAAITSTSLSIPFAKGKLLMGTWQGVYLIEHRQAPHQRRIVVTLLSSG